jgi:hypothetical protein
MIPKPATPIAQGGTPSPTKPMAIPAPVLRDAFFLLNIETGNIHARKFLYVIL